jgi:hypothetical protein
MPTPHRKQPPRKRNASGNKHKAKAKRFRNATPAASPRAVAQPRARAADRERGAASAFLRTHEMGEVLTALAGAGLSSVGGALAVRYGVHPYLASIGLGAAGILTAWQADRPWLKNMTIGMASAAGSQLVLLGLNPRVAIDNVATAPPPKPAPQQLATVAPPPALPAPKPRAADLGGLPPGMLDAALERARTDLAVANDGYPPGYEPYPEGHNHSHNHEHTHLNH